MTTEQQTNNSSCLLDRFKVQKIIIKNKYLHISGVDGHGAIFASDKGFYQIDQFDIKNIIESLFSTLTVEQKKNLVKQLGDSVS